MNRNLFGLVVITVIILISFLASCDITTRYNVLYVKHNGNSSTKAMQIVRAKSTLQAVAQVEKDCWLTCDSITIKRISKYR